MDGIANHFPAKTALDCRNLQLYNLKNFSGTDTPRLRKIAIVAWNQTPICASLASVPIALILRNDHCTVLRCGCYGNGHLLLVSRILLVLRQNRRTAATGVHADRMHSLKKHIDKHLSLDTAGTRRSATYRPTHELHRRLRRTPNPTLLCTRTLNNIRICLDRQRDNYNLK